MQNDGKKVHTVLKYGYIRRSGNFFPSDTWGVLRQSTHAADVLITSTYASPPKKKTWCLDRRERCQDHNCRMKALPPGTFTGYCVNNTKRAHTKRRPTSTLRVFGARRYARNNFLFHESRSKRKRGRKASEKGPFLFSPPRIL